jgi:hypothetical protein
MPLALSVTAMLSAVSDRNLGRDAIGFGVVDAVVGELLGDHQRPVIGIVAAAATGAGIDVTSARREVT